MLGSRSKPYKLRVLRDAAQAAPARRPVLHGIRQTGSKNFHLALFGPPESAFPPLSVQMTLPELDVWLRTAAASAEQASVIQAGTAPGGVPAPLRLVAGGDTNRIDSKSSAAPSHQGMPGKRSSTRVERPPREQIAVLIAAGGAGLRMGAGEPKLRRHLHGQALLWWSLRLFLRHAGIGRIVVVSPPGALKDLRALAPQAADAAQRTTEPTIEWIEGGAERQDSVYAGLQALAKDPPAWVLVHDGARPLCSPQLVQRILEGLHNHEALTPVVPIVDSLRRAQGAQSMPVARESLYRVQTPQGFRWEILWKAHQNARSTGLLASDDVQLVEALGVSPTLVPGEVWNWKITTAEDLLCAEGWLRADSSSQQTGP